jgi:hypothetical protein
MGDNRLRRAVRTRCINRFAWASALMLRSGSTPSFSRRSKTGKFRGEAVPILVAERSRLVHLFGANTRAHGVISEATMPTPKRHALTILGAFEEARSELVGKAVILTDGRAGTVENVWLDEVHGLRVSIRGHIGKWPVSTIKFAQP